MYMYVWETGSDINYVQNEYLGFHWIIIIEIYNIGNISDLVLEMDNPGD